MKWIPPWLAKAYARLHLAKGRDIFDFSEAGAILELKDKRPIGKTLAKLRTFGYMTVRRDPLDPRKKLFRLVDPQSIVLAMAIQSRAKTDDVAEKLRAVSGYLEYYVSGAYAAYEYHRYSATESMDISVRPDQLLTWIALLSEPNIALSIDEIPAEKPASTNIHLHSDFDETLSKHTRVIDGIRYLSPEALVTLGIAKENLNMEDVLAILIAYRKRLDWKALLDLSEAHNAGRFLGCILDILNSESQKPLFEKNLINNILRRSNLHARLDFPTSMITQPAEKLYGSISSKWNLRLHLTHALVSKVLTDLVR